MRGAGRWRRRRSRRGTGYRRGIWNEILRAAGTADDLDARPINGSNLLDQVVIPALSEAEQAFAAALSRINIEELARSAEGARKSGSGNANTP